MATKTEKKTALGKPKKKVRKKTLWDLILKYQEKPFWRVPEKYKKEVFG